MLAIWIVIPAYYVTMALISTDIVNGVCLPWSAPPSLAALKMILTSAILISYLLPLALMIFCYSRVVYELRIKVKPIDAHHRGWLFSEVFFVLT